MRTKKPLALVVVIALIVCSIQTAFAVPTNDIVTAAQQLVSLYLSSSTNSVSSASSAILYDQIPAYSFQDGFLETISNTDYYPVDMEGRIIGIFIVSRNDTDGEVYSFSSEFADELTAFSAKNEQVCIVFDKMKMYLQGASSWKKVYDSHGYPLEPNSVVQALDTMTFENSKIDTQDLDFYNAASPGSIATLQIQRNNTRARTQLNLELWNQHNLSSTNQLCWAGAVWSIGSYVKGDSTSWSPVSIAKKINGDTGYNKGLQFSEMPGIYKTIYTITTSAEGGQLSYSDIILNIDGDTPMHTSWQSTNYGHSMGLVGYGNNEEICVNDTNIGNYRWLQKNASAGEWFYNYGETYTWSDTIVP